MTIPPTGDLEYRLMMVVAIVIPLPRGPTPGAEACPNQPTCYVREDYVVKTRKTFIINIYSGPTKSARENPLTGRSTRSVGACPFDGVNTDPSTRNFFRSSDTLSVWALFMVLPLVRGENNIIVLFGVLSFVVVLRGKSEHFLRFPT